MKRKPEAEKRIVTSLSISPWLHRLVRKAAKQRGLSVSAFISQVLKDHLVGRRVAFWLSLDEKGNPRKGGYIPWSEEVLDMRYRLELEDLQERMAFWKNLFLLYQEAQKHGKSLVEWMAERGNLKDFLEDSERNLPPEEQVKVALQRAREYQEAFAREEADAEREAAKEG